ncbi:MAG: SUMF1/EgtB/PvdO family nonheme iron enzyme [Magnetococcales bacterium]|nr:SUMF1/EgtB/PvdO family nonheme iron enzyme [Magnetococcales bacterium]
MGVVFKSGLAKRSKTTPRPRLKPGDTVGSGRYRVETLLGEGAFGQIYKVLELATGATRALKRARYLKHKRLFSIELDHLRRLQGTPHVLPLYDHYVDKDRSDVFITEYLDGGTLKEWILDRGCLGIAEALGILDQMTRALTAAHSLIPPVLHRDIKPSNILGRKLSENQMQWYLSDWGLAVTWSGSREPVVSGTYSYTAPEVWDKKRYPVSDVYSLGMTLFFMIFGSPAYDGDSTLVRHLQRGPDPVIIDPSCPAAIKILLEGMLAKDPKQRWTLPQVIHHVRGDRTRPKGIAILRSVLKAGRLWQVNLGGGQVMDFSWIPAGHAPVPQDQDAKETIALPHDGFWMGRRPVTRGQFAIFVQETGHVTRAERQGWGWIGNPVEGRLVKQEGVDWKNPGFAQGEDQPVVLLDYADAREFVRWLGCRAGRWMGLPTETQWVAACGTGKHPPMIIDDAASDSTNGHPVQEWIGNATRDRLFREESRRFPNKKPEQILLQVVRGTAWHGIQINTWPENEVTNGLGFRVAGLALSWES